ncbi:MAG: hypothetical protein ABSF22_16505 [Bryobacteraceae bacterium]
MPDLSKATVLIVNDDGDLRLSYLAGWGINSVLEDDLYRKIITYRTLPVAVFIGSPEYVQKVLTSLTN